MLLTLFMLGIIPLNAIGVPENETETSTLGVNLLTDAPQLESNTSSYSPELRDPQQVAEAANTMFEEYWEIVLLEGPEFATMLNDHRYDDKLASLSLKSYEKKKVMMNEFLERANQMLPLAAEGSETESNLELFITNLHYKLDQLMTGSYLFPLSKLDTPQMSLLLLLKYTKINTTEQYWNLIARYRAIPRQIDEQIELMREGIRTNFTLHERSMLDEQERWNGSLVDSPFYKPFLNISSFVPEEEIDAIQQNASDAVLNSVIPAFTKISDFMKNEYHLHLRPEIGAGTLPNGRDFYIHQLSQHLTDSGVTPEEIHQMGLMEVERILKEMDEVIHLLGLNLTREEFSNQLRTDPSQLFASEEEALETYRQVIDNEITPKLPMLFKIIPQKILTVEKIPKEMATGPRAYYMSPSPDNSTPATFFLDTSSLKNIPKYEVITLAMHEGVPGHHFQISYAMEQNDYPEFRKYETNSNAFLEGWALYAEYLGYEMGLYEDPYMRYGHLSEEIFRACRMVVDTGMHVLGWSRQRAIDYMLSHSASTLDNIKREVDRYITWPGQACSYKYGEMKIKALRNKSETALGPAFDIRDFHDVILRNNGPLELVEKHIDRYISSSKALLGESGNSL